MLFILGLLVPVFAATLRGVVPGLQEADYFNTVLELRNIDTFARELRHLSPNGTFSFYNLELDNRYRLSLVSDTLKLGWSYVVTVRSHSDLVVRKVLHSRSLDTGHVIVDSDPLEIAGYERPELVAERETFSILKFFTQTTVWLSIGCLVLVTYLPSLLENLDPELLEELQKNQIQVKAPQQDFDLAKSIADRRVKD